MSTKYSVTGEVAQSTQKYENPDPIDNRIPTGYEGTNIPDDFFIPECNIEDVDRAVFNLFDKSLQFTVEQSNEQKKVPVIFATGERFALVKRLKPIRDDNGALILPLISIRRQGIDQTIGHGHGIGQNTGDLIVKRRLSNKDRKYQQIINKMNVRNQDNVSSDNTFIDTTDPKKGVKPGRVASRNYQESATPISINDNLGNNVYEVITIPFPHFYTMTYEVTFWTQYTVHMNSMLEHFMVSYQAPGNQFRIDTDKGYWFVAYINNEFSDGTNFDDFTDQERIVRYTFSLTVDGYLIANKTEGRLSPFRSFISAPQISFGIEKPAANIKMGSKNDSPIGSGDPNVLTIDDATMLDQNGKDLVWRGFGDPNGRGHRLLSRNAASGESVWSAKQTDLGALDTGGPSRGSSDDGGHCGGS